MAFRWSHWPEASLQSINASETAEEKSRRQQETDAKLHDVVKQYVERASNEENRYAEPVELETIKTYAQHPSLLKTIISSLIPRLSQGYPFNIKALDILIHLLHAHLLPHPAFYPPTSLLYAPVIELANISTLDHPTGVAGHVKAKADEFLVGVGYEVRLGSAWVSRSRGTDWGNSAWMRVGAASPSSWVDDQGFSLSTTTVSQGAPTPKHFEQHGVNHLHSMQGTEKKWSLGKWW